MTLQVYKKVPSRTNYKIQEVETHSTQCVQENKELPDITLNHEEL